MSEYIPYPFYYDDVPVDISFVFENEKPAGKHGFIKTQGRHFVFEDGTRARFWGTNLNGGANFPEHDYAEKLAKRLGYLPTKSAAKGGGYSTYVFNGSCPYESGEILVEESIGAVRKMF